MKKFLLIITIISCIFFPSCKIMEDKETSYEFLKDISEIQTIEIVLIKDFDEDNEESYKVGPALDIILQIKEKENFLNEFNLLKSYLHWYPHTAEGISTGEKAIKILYKSGEYEIIGANGEGYYTYGGNNVGGGWAYHNFGFYYFEEQEFYSFINKYVQPTD
ncbi:MAG: hypothetical protein IKA72_05350 [Clostridia bacterium]|nr:hypothetical protein [Clostridia bacterium]